MTVLLELQNVAKEYAAGAVRAVDGVSLSIAPGETLGLVGESGCGKSSLARLVMRLMPPSSGQVLFDGRDVWTLSAAELKTMRQRIQMVFQDPFASLNPRFTIGQTLREPLEIHGLPSGVAPVEALLQQVGLPVEFASRHPHQLSGGQRQRVGLARALATRPALIVADEPVSALDVSVQAQVVNLLQDVQAASNLSYLFISHDLEVVRHLSHRIAVMYLGKLVEVGTAEQIVDHPQHPYTRALVDSIPGRGSGARLAGDPPNPKDLPPGCRFQPRCRFAIDVCKVTHPELRALGDERLVACHRAPLEENVVAGAPQSQPNAGAMRKNGGSEA